MRPIVERVDHIFVPYEEPEPVMRFFVQELGLPQAWPYDEYGFFTSGGVVFGDANIEFIKSNEMITAAHPARVQGIAFASPHIDDGFLDELDRRGIAHSAPMAGPYWTNVLFEGFLAPDSVVFLCEYHTERIAVGDRINAMKDVAGIEGISEIVVGATDERAAIDLWQKLFDPLQPTDPGVWAPDAGPRIRIRTSDIDGVEEIVVRGEANTGFENEVLGGLRIVLDSG